MAMATATAMAMAMTTTTMKAGLAFSPEREWYSIMRR
jgi:hypothetical protein